MIFRFILLFSFIINQTALFSQIINQSTVTAQQQIKELKGSALLVLLKTQKNKINALRKHGQNAEAEKLEKKQRAYNLSAVTAFRQEFSFCPVYFFLSDYGPKVYNKDFASVVFLNDSLKEDASIKFSGPVFYMAEFGVIEQDTIQNRDIPVYQPDKNGSLAASNTYYGGADFGFGALLIKSDKFIQLRKPFPYYVRTFDGLPLKRSLNTVVKKMNDKLFAFYEKSK